MLSGGGSCDSLCSEIFSDIGVGNSGASTSDYRSDGGVLQRFWADHGHDGQLSAKYFPRKLDSLVIDSGNLMQFTVVRGRKT